ncbi:MbnP family copper-binding protein [Thalassotalea ganghwensis]
MKKDNLLFAPYYGEKRLNCKQMLVLGNDDWQIDQLQLFVSNIDALDRQGEWQSLDMANNDYQTKNVALLGGECHSAREKKNNWQVVFADSVVLSHYQRIRFTLGVPFELNHLNPLTQESPLNMPSMFWVWRTGHKFLRLEMSSTNDAWVFHLGSTGCKAISPVRPPTSPCLNPNQVVIDLPMPSDNAVILDLKALLSGITLSEQTSCQSDPDNLHCQSLFERIGVNGEQQVFGVKSE